MPLVEPTKYLEKVFADTLTVTQSLKGIYNKGYILNEMSYAFVSGDDVFTINGQKWNFWNPIFQDYEVRMPLTADDIVDYSAGTGIYETSVNSITTSWGGSLGLGDFIPPLSKGNYTIKFRLSLKVTIPIIGTDIGIYDFTFAFEVEDIVQTKEPLTVSDVLQRIASVCETRRNGIEEPRFVIDPVILAKYNSLPCPEFGFSRQTLWEMLLQIGDYIHAIPRLISDVDENWNVVSFDFLGSQEDAVNGGKLSYVQGSYNIDDYVTDIDSHISNITNTDNMQEGSLVDPANNIFKTVRVEEGGTEVTDDNALFRTDKPIARLMKVEVLYNGDVYDITKYIYENYEYSTLSAYQAVFPYSKAYALMYSIGANNITKVATQE